MSENPIIASVRSLAETRPDTVYHGHQQLLSYTGGIATNGHMGCLVGQALVSLGVRKSLLAESFLPAEAVVDTLSSQGLLPAHLSDPADRAWLRWVQELQDLGWAWGDVIAYADGDAAVRRTISKKYAVSIDA